VALLAAGGITAGSVLTVAGEFVLQMSVGLVAGVVGGRALLWFMRHVALPAEGLYPLRTLASAFVIYGVASIAHGSGFLAVFIAGIILGDARAPFKREIERFHSALASLAEIVAFVILGLTVNLADLTTPEVWIPGLILGAAVAFLIRPVLVGRCLLPVRLRWREKTFIVFAGLKGAVPILLASYLLAANIPRGSRLYGIVIIVVVFSVLVQGSLVPTVARVLRVPMRTVHPEPWSLGIRLRGEPEGFHRFTIAPGSPAEGRTIEQLADLPVDVWVSFVVRDCSSSPTTTTTTGTHRHLRDIPQRPPPGRTHLAGHRQLTSATVRDVPRLVAQGGSRAGPDGSCRSRSHRSVTVVSAISGRPFDTYSLTARRISRCYTVMREPMITVRSRGRPKYSRRRW